MAKLLDENGLSHFWSLIKAKFAQGAKIGNTNLTVDSTDMKIVIPTATTTADGVMSSQDKIKLNGVAAGAQVNVIESVKVNGTALTVTRKAVDIPLATTSSAGVMSASDKTKLDTVASNSINNINVNGITGSVANGVASVSVSADDIQLDESSLKTQAQSVDAALEELYDQTNLFVSLTDSGSTVSSSVAFADVIAALNAGRDVIYKLEGYDYHVVQHSSSLVIAFSYSTEDTALQTITHNANSVTHWFINLTDAFIGMDSYNDFAQKNNTVLTGVPTAPTATSGTNTTQIATTAFVQSTVSSAISGITDVYTYKGSKATYAQLPSSGNKIGDVWNVEAEYIDSTTQKIYPAGTNWAWNGSSWDALGGEIILVTNSEIDTIVAS